MSRLHFIQSQQSSKVSKLREEVKGKISKGKDSDDDLEDERCVLFYPCLLRDQALNTYCTLTRNNVQNDALLRKLVHTQLLSGVANPDLNLTPAQRKKALAGRIQELSGHAKLGKGEKSVRAKERNRASKHIRDGMAEKQAERRAKQLSEVCTGSQVILSK